MAEYAQVTSVEAIEAFRASLVIYLSKARPAVEQASAEVMRTRLWVTDGQQQHWEKELRRRLRQLEEARSELFNARLSVFQDSTLLQNMAVQRRQRAVEEAEGKLALLKKWSREMESRVEPLIKQLEQFQGFLAVDLGKANAYLGQIVKALAAYAELSRASVPAASAPEEPKV